jgi:hypothetical protein
MSFRTTARAASLFLLVITLSLTGCAKRQVAAPVVPSVEPEPYRGPVTVEVLKGSRAFEGITTLRSEVKARVFRHGEKEGTFKGIFAFRAPNNVRLKLLSPIGLTAMEMVITNGEMQMFVPHRDTLYEGPSPRLSMPADAVYGMEIEEDGYILYAFRPYANVMELMGKYSFQADTLRNTGVTIYRDGRRYMGVMFGDFSGRVPGVVSLSFFNGYIMDLELQEPEADVDIPEKFFAPIEPTGDTQVVPLKFMMENNSF